MQQSIVKLHSSEIKFLKALFSDGHKTDAEIARETELSKATANRIRKKLEESKILVDYVPVIDLDKFGVQLFAVVLFEWTNFADREATKKMEKEFVETPQVVYFAAGESSSNLHYCAFLGFFDLNDYHEFFDELRHKHGKSLAKIEYFLIPAKRIIKQDFTGLAKLAIQRGAVE